MSWAMARATSSPPSGLLRVCSMCVRGLLCRFVRCCVPGPGPGALLQRPPLEPGVREPVIVVQHLGRGAMALAHLLLAAGAVLVAAPARPRRNAALELVVG